MNARGTEEGRVEGEGEPHGRVIRDERDVEEGVAAELRDDSGLECGPERVTSGPTRQECWQDAFCPANQKASRSILSPSPKTLNASLAAPSAQKKKKTTSLMTTGLDPLYRKFIYY